MNPKSKGDAGPGFLPLIVNYSKGFIPKALSDGDAANQAKGYNPGNAPLLAVDLNAVKKRFKHQ